MQTPAESRSSTPPATPPFDAVLVLGGGLTPAGVPHPWVIARLEQALTIPGEPALVCLSAYSPHTGPHRNVEGLLVTEASAAATWLLQRGCDPGRIFTEASSLDTIGNAYFARVQHVEPRGWSRLLVVTSEFHLPRTRAVFETVLGLPNRHGERWNCEFVGTDNSGLAADILRERSDKESRALERWLRQVAEADWQTLADFHRWLWTEHACYAPGLVPTRESGRVTGSY